MKFLNYFALYFPQFGLAHHLCVSLKLSSLRHDPGLCPSCVCSGQTRPASVQYALTLAFIGLFRIQRYQRKQAFMHTTTRVCSTRVWLCAQVYARQLAWHACQTPLLLLRVNAGGALLPYIRARPLVQIWLHLRLHLVRVSTHWTELLQLSVFLF